MHDRRVLRGEVRRCDDGINSVSDCPLHQWQHICFKTGRHVWPPTAAMFVSETNIVFTIHTIANMHGLVKKNFRGDVFFIFSMSTMHKMCTIEKRKPRTDPRRGDTGIRQPRDGSLESVGRGVNRATRRWLQVASTALHRVQSIPQSLPIEGGRTETSTGDIRINCAIKASKCFSRLTMKVMSVHAIACPLDQT